MKNLRHDALQKLAILSASSPTNESSKDIARLCRRCPGPRLKHQDGSQSGSRMSMRLPELEALLSLCQAAPHVTDIETAAQLLAQLTSYLPESHIQNLSVPVRAMQGGPSPWEVLTNSLSSAVLSLGLNHPSLRHHASATVSRYVYSWLKASRSCNSAQLDSRDEDDEFVTGLVSQTVILAMSIAGFLNAAVEHPEFWSADDRLHLLNILNEGLSDNFMIALETSLSIIRNSRQPQGELKMWKLYSRQYATSGRPLGAMLLRLAFTQLISAIAALEVAGPSAVQGFSVLDQLLVDGQGILTKDTLINEALVEVLAEAATGEIKLLEEGSDYLELGSAWQQRLASAVKAHSLTTLLCCSILDEEIADPDALLARLEGTISSPVLAQDEDLAAVVFKSIAVLSKFSPAVAANVSRLLSRIIVQGGLDSKTAAVAAQSLASILTKLPQDATITTLYSLGNVLSAGGTHPERTLSASPVFDNKPTKNARNTLYNEPGGSVISLGPSGDEPSLVYLTTIEAIVCIACTCGEDKIIALALSMLIQKINRLSLEVDAKIIVETSALGVHSAPSEFRSLLKLYSRICHDALIQGNSVILDAVMRARLHLSQGIKRGADLFEIYLLHLLDAIVSQGDARNGDNKHIGNTELASQEIAQLLRPLASFASANYSPDSDDLEIDGFLNLQRDAWFNAVVHGFTLTSALGKKYRHELQLLAQYSHPLIAEDRADHLESDIELNTTLRRGKSTDHANEYRKHLIEALPASDSDIKTLNYSELVFLTSAYLVENLRAMSGDCTSVLTYFLDPRLKSGPLANCMFQVAISAVRTFLSRTISGKGQFFSAPYVAQQLALFFSGCCHRISKVQHVARSCADLILMQIPSSLCYKSSLFALFELLSIMWISCLDQDTEEYEWRSHFTSSRGKVSVELSDDYSLRRQTLFDLQKWARIWIERVLNIAPLDIKGLIQTYLSEYEDDGASYNISLGRSFALEMGGMIPSTDQRLGAIENQPGVHINTASDLIAQYTTRQEYRFVGADRGDEPWVNAGAETDPTTTKMRRFKQSVDEAKRLLSDIEERTTNRQSVPFSEIRDVLRRAGALLCRTDNDEGALVHHLVGVPFAVFTKQAINLGISLWTGVLKENARMESRILAEVAECWEDSIRKRRGLFDQRLQQLDPFSIKMEFAPSDKALISRRQHFANELITPHLRILQFFSSHCSASRLGAPHIQRMYQRLINVTLDALRGKGSNPLAREAHFHIIHLGLRILRFSSNLSEPILWRFKDRILTAALSWFSFRPKWSFGGNRLQIKAETHLLSDVHGALDKIKHIGAAQSGPRKSLQARQDLLSLLIVNEQNRLTVWLFPLEHERRHHLITSHSTKMQTDAFLAACLQTAWLENPALAIQFAQRFHSLNLINQLRFKLCSFPEKVLNNAEALEISIGQFYPTDFSHQLKYLLYWDCVNPITAIQFFLPAYGNDPFIIQYAMRVLEHHSVDTTFFYVPQIVQTLRYDELGYVERYIIETGKFSQLFAHQIIWNMKANAFKDEDSQIPDAVKPVLDRVMSRLISSFSPEDRAFYEREFSFFNEVTGISGKLKPLIRRSKPEKKQKIEEELRKIKVETGVYLPSNPDGVVIGIDRKSGKPLQSHAKAPYMATFRIRKKVKDAENEEQLIKSNGKSNGNGAHVPETFEVWQSAIFKVGDDCRQDVLALQMIAAFRGIFHSVGLDVYVNPYRVTATAPGCGVIDVLPNSISRDMLGREAVNGLYDYFISKYGGEDSIRFQEARNNFVKSMAAYSVISFLLQFKDRHNGNIMIDDAGHILHIDFGFCFDIVPGGVKFERAPFKLTAEMVAVMGGPTAQSYRWFEELCVKAFLATRPHSEHLIQMVGVMLDSGLPCFKPTTTQHLRDRFVLDKSEREAGEFMKDLIGKSYNSFATKGYDQFQLWTNGIPY